MLVGKNCNCKNCKKAHNSVLIGPKNLNFGTETHCMVLPIISNFATNSF